MLYYCGACGWVGYEDAVSYTNDGTMRCPMPECEWTDLWNEAYIHRMLTKLEVANDALRDYRR